MVYAAQYLGGGLSLGMNGVDIAQRGQQECDQYAVLFFFFFQAEDGIRDSDM